MRGPAEGSTDAGPDAAGAGAWTGWRPNDASRWVGPGGPGGCYLGLGSGGGGGHLQARTARYFRRTAARSDMVRPGGITTPCILVMHQWVDPADL